MIPALMEWGAEEAARIIDYTDMIWLPYYLKDTINLFKYEWVLVDEAQDLSKAQKEIVLASVTENGRVVAVGDPNQAIYSFAGADYNSFLDLKKTLSAKSLPLATCYRCPKNHIDLAKTIVPHITAFKQNKGEVSVVEYEDMHHYVKEGDLIISRITSPLISLCYFLIANKIKATVRGKDIGVGLKSFLFKLKLPKTFDKAIFTQKLNSYYGKEKANLLKNDMENMADILDEKVNCVRIIFDNAQSPITTIKDFEKEVDSIFNDNIKGVVLSTVHKAKGLEADNVYILNENMMPYYRAVTEEDYRQELNLRYVALTRAKENLYFTYSSKNTKRINLDRYQ
jgi:superfamily I DNA/RNA helicase